MPKAGEPGAPVSRAISTIVPVSRFPANTAYADQIRPFVPGHYRVLGTDGFGRSDRRERLRYFFEVNRFFVAVAALKSLADTGAIPPATVRQAIERFKIDPAKPNPMRS